MFSSLVLGFHRGSCRELLECHRVPFKKSYAVFVRAAVLPRGYVGIYWRQSHQKKAMFLYASRGERVFFQLSRIRVGLIWRTGRPVVVRMIQGRLVAVGYHSRHPDRCPRLTHHHRCRRRILADMPKNWYHQHCSHPIFDDESRVSLYHFDHRSCESHLFLGCNNPLAFQQHNEKLGHARYSCRGWLWTHQKIAHETSAEGPNCGACVPTYGGSSDGQESVWGIVLNVLGDIQLLLNALEPCGQRHGIQFAWSAPSWFWRAERKLYHLKMHRRAWSSFDVIVFNRCPSSPWVRPLLSRTQRKTF